MELQFRISNQCLFVPPNMKNHLWIVIVLVYVPLVVELAKESRKPPENLTPIGEFTVRVGSKPNNSSRQPKRTLFRASGRDINDEQLADLDATNHQQDNIETHSASDINTAEDENRGQSDYQENHIVDDYEESDQRNHYVADINMYVSNGKSYEMQRFVCYGVLDKDKAQSREVPIYRPSRRNMTSTKAPSAHNSWRRKKISRTRQ